MTQADRDRLVALKKAKKKTDYAARGCRGAGVEHAAGEAVALCVEKRGDKAVIHGLRGKPSNRRIEEGIEREAVKILRDSAIDPR